MSSTRKNRFLFPLREGQEGEADDRARMARVALYTFSASLRPAARCPSGATGSSAIVQAIPSSPVAPSERSRSAALLPVKVNKAPRAGPSSEGVRTCGRYPAEQVERVKKLSVSLLIALVGFPQISETIYTPALPDVAWSLNTTAYWVEATLAIYFAGFALGVLLWGAISDFTGRKPPLIFGIFVYGAATFFCGQTQAVEMLLLGRFVQAFGASAGSVITQTILRDAYSGPERAQIFSLLSGALAFSPAIGPLLGGFITQMFGWRVNFFFLALMALVLLLWTLSSLTETRPQDASRQSLKELKRLAVSMFLSKELLGHILLIGGTNGILFGFYQEAPFVFIEQLGISPGAYGCCGLLIAAATLLASRLCYRQSDRLGGALIRLGCVCILLGGMLFSLLVMSKLFFLPQLGLVLALLVLFPVFFGIGLIIPNSLSVALKAYSRAAGTAGSIFGGSYYCLIAVCTWMMSAFHTGTALPLPGYITLLGVVIVFGAHLNGLWTRHPVSVQPLN